MLFIRTHPCGLLKKRFGHEEIVEKEIRRQDEEERSPTPRDTISDGDHSSESPSPRTAVQFKPRPVGEMKKGRHNPPGERRRKATGGGVRRECSLREGKKGNPKKKP